MNIPGARRHINDQVIQFIPIYIGYKLPDGTACHGTAPHDSTFFVDQETNEFTCAVRRLEGGCDWFVVRIDRERQRVTVALDERDAGCVLGF